MYAFLCQESNELENEELTFPIYHKDSHLIHNCSCTLPRFPIHSTVTKLYSNAAHYPHYRYTDNQIGYRKSVISAVSNISYIMKSISVAIIKASLVL